MAKKKKQDEALGFLRSLEVTGFRRFSKLKLDNLGRINVFLGSNNTGKTSILESIFSFACGKHLKPLIANGILREKETNGPYNFAEKLMRGFYDVDSVFFQFSFKAEMEDQAFNVTHTLIPYEIFSELLPRMEIRKVMERSMVKESNIDQGSLQLVDGKLIESSSLIPIVRWKVDINGKRSHQNIYYPFGFNLDLTDKPIKGGRYNDLLDHRNSKENIRIFSHLKRKGILKDFIHEIKTTFKGVEDIDYIPYPGGSETVVFKVKNGDYLPIYNFGDGLVRWYNILGGMIIHPNTIHCMEEIDATFHPTAQVELVKNLIKYSKKYSNQIFLTSHSLEFVDNMLEAMEPMLDQLEDEIKFITIKDNEEGNPITRTLNGREAFESRNEFKIDLR